MVEEQSPRQMRLSSSIRGVLIAAIVGGYAWFFKQPGASLAELLLVAAGLQLVVILLRKFVAPQALPQAMNAFELLVDGATVLMFALGVYGSMFRFAASI